MINNLNNPNTLLIIGVMVIYVILSFLIVRSTRQIRNKPYIHNEYTKVNKKQYDYVITSSECVLCDRIDVIHIDNDTLFDLCNKSSINVGEYSIQHYGDGTLKSIHYVKHQLSSIGEYVGNVIPHKDLQKALDDNDGFVHIAD